MKRHRSLGVQGVGLCHFYGILCSPSTTSATRSVAISDVIVQTANSDPIDDV